MSALDAIQTYYQLFGARGVMAVAKARFLHETTEAPIAVPGLEHPVYLRLRTTDVSVFRQVFVTREYDSEFSMPPRVIVDAGANIGLTSLFYLSKYPEAMIIAIEPESSNFRMLTKNIEPYPNIVAIQAALWKENGSITLVDPGFGNYGFQTLEGVGPIDLSCQRPTRALTLDSLMSDLHLDSIDILKVDIEGSEKEVFATSTAWIDRVGVIVVELHDHLREGCTNTVLSATRRFGRQWRVGETVFFAHNDEPTKTQQRQDRARNAVGSISPGVSRIFRILE